MRETLGELSGLDLSAADASASFLEFGFDSLLLTQASQVLASRFGVKVGFRRLLEDLSTFEALAAHLDRELPARPLPAPPAAAPLPAASAPSPAPGPAAEGRQELIAAQLELMSRQLELLRQLTAAASGVAAPRAEPAQAPAAREVKPRERVLPLTDAQTEVWLAAQLGDDASRAHNESVTVHLGGPLDLTALRRAFQDLFERHEGLRISFDPAGDAQRVAPLAAPDLPLVDVSGESESGRAAAVAALVAQESANPFDLSRGPLLRALLVRLEPLRHLLLLTVHHIACDGYSYEIVLRDLGRLYAARAAGEPPRLAPATPLSEFIDWERQDAQRAERRANEAYWLEKFREPPAPLDLPTDRPRPPVKTYRGGREVERWPASLYGDIQRMAREQGCTMFTTLFAAFGLLLSRLSRQSDLVIGVPAAGQLLIGGPELVGHCVNFLPIRLRVDSSEEVPAYLARVRREVLDAHDHQNYTFGRLLQKLAIGRDASRVPLVSVSFNLDRYFPGLAFGPLAVDVEKNPKPFVLFEAAFNLVETPEGALLECEYNADLFEAETIRRWLGHYRTLLEEAVREPRRRVAELPLLTEPDRRALLQAWNDTAEEYPRDRCLHQLFEEQAARTPRAVAAVSREGRWTYAELQQRSERVAALLRRRGVGPEVPVAVCVDRSLEMLAALLGVLKAGGAYVPLDPSHPRERLALILEDARAPVVLTQKQWLERLPVGGDDVVLLDNLSRATVPAPSGSGRKPGPENLSYVLYTSGSTGRPKGVAIEHRSAVALMAWAGRVYGREELAGVLASTAITFDLSVFEIFLPLSFGGRVILAEDSLRWTELRAAREVTLVNTVPSAMAELLRLGLPDSVRTVNLAGEALPGPLVRKIYAETSVRRVFNLYGPTEATTYSTVRLVPRDEPGEPTIGRPIGNSRAYILDESFEPAPAGVAGELTLGGAGIARGYWNAPDRTAEAFLPDAFGPHAGARLYRTGDLARHRPDGQIEFLGRRDHQVKLRGYRIELPEIESVLASLPGVREASVLLREDEPGEKRLVAYVVTDSGGQDATERVRGELAEKLPAPMVPGFFVALDALPRTPHGKVNRAALPAPPSRPERRSSRRVPPREPLERRLVEIWERLFKVSPIGLEDDFFELGGHSLLAVRLFTAIEKALGKRLPLATILQAPTIEQLASVLRREGWTPGWSSLVPIQPAGSRPPLYCIHAAGGNVLTYRDLARYLGPDQPVYGLQAVGLHGNREPHRTVQEMAAHYISEIRTLQPDGPYFLGGSSYGGIVAYEMAQQLHAGGLAVGLLALFDTYAPGYPRELPNVTRARLRWNQFAERVELHWSNLTVGTLEDRITYASVKARRLSGRVRQKLRRFTQRALPRNLRRVDASSRQAIENYQPSPYVGKLTLFRASRQPAGYEFDPELGWGPLAVGGLEIYEVPGHHGSIVYEPRIRVLAEKLRFCLQKALPGRGVRSSEARLPGA